MASSLMARLVRPGGWLDFVLPPLCSGCGEYTEEGSFVCTACQGLIQTISEPSCLKCGSANIAKRECPVCKRDSFLLYAFGEYRDPLREIIIQLKFKGVTVQIDDLAERVCAQFGDRLALYEGALLVPIPLHSSRQHSRGYNQASLFARELSKRLDLDVDEELLYRVEKRKPQTKLQVREREANITGVFAVSEDVEPAARIILVDDVVTTGHTVGEAKRQLERSGHHVCAVIAMAR